MSACQLNESKGVITATSVNGDSVEIFRHHPSSVCKDINPSLGITIRIICLKDIFGASDGANSLVQLSKYDRGAAFPNWVRLTETPDELRNAFAHAGCDHELPPTIATIGGIVRKMYKKLESKFGIYF